jgi:hypothetical protein
MVSVSHYNVEFNVLTLQSDLVKTFFFSQFVVCLLLILLLLLYYIFFFGGGGFSEPIDITRTNNKNTNRNTLRQLIRSDFDGILVKKQYSIIITQIISNNVMNQF